MGYKDLKYRRYILFLPINENTETHITDMINYVYSVTGGCTYTRFHIPAINLGVEEVNGYLIGKFANYPNEDVVCIIADIENIEIKKLHNKLKKLIKKIKEMNEDAVWLTYNDIMLCQ